MSQTQWWASDGVPGRAGSKQAAGRLLLLNTFHVSQPAYRSLASTYQVSTSYANNYSENNSEVPSIRLPILNSITRHPSSALAEPQKRLEVFSYKQNPY